MVAARERHPGPASGPARRLVAAATSLAPEERLAALAALALWFSMFLPWYGKAVTETHAGSLQAAGYTLSAFGAFSFVEAAVLLVASGILVLLFARAERRAFHLPGGDGAVILIGGVWVGLLVFYRMLDKPGTTGDARLTTTIGLQWGIFVALAAAIGLAYAGTRLRAARRPEPNRVDDPTLKPRRPRPPDETSTRTTVVERPTERTERLPLDVDLADPPDFRRVPRRDPDVAREPDPFGER